MSVEIQYTKESKTYREGGIHLLTLSLCRVALSGEEVCLGEVAAFYDAWLACVTEACECELLPRLRRAYMDDPSPRKRFTHRPCLVAMTVSHEWQRRARRVDVLRVTRCVTLTEEGVTRELFREVDRLEARYGGFLS